MTIWDKDSILALIDQHDVAVKRALIALYQRQTATERSVSVTIERNGVGFSAFDAERLSSMAKWCMRTNYITPKMAAAARRPIRKYWRQLRDIANGKLSQS